MAVLQTKIFRGCILLSNKEAYPAFKGSGIQFIYKDKDYKSGDTVQIRWRPDSDSPAIWLSDTLTVSGTPAEPIFDWARSSGLNLPDKSAIQIWITRDGEEVYRTNICPLQRVDSKSGSSAGQYRRVLTRSASEFTFNDSTIATAGEYSFYDCDGLTEVKINNVSRINNNAFAECDNLKDIWLLRNSVATLESVNAIPNTVENIWVPRDLEHTYEAAPVWKDLVDCEERIKPYPPEVVTLGHVDFQATAAFRMCYELNYDNAYSNDPNFQPGKWDGQLFYSTDGVNWQEWNKVVAIGWINAALGADSKYHVYLRGIGNHKLTDIVETESGNRYCKFGIGPILDSAEVSVVGKLENMFDCERVAAGAHPNMASNACSYLFCSDMCIRHLDTNFFTGLTPTAYCYASMFSNSALRTFESYLPNKVAPYCYANMFLQSRHMETVPTTMLPATTLAEGCYYHMFDTCRDLENAPLLPATTLAEKCYEGMFITTAIAKIPSIQATYFPAACCKEMMRIGAELSKTKTATCTHYYRIPADGEATAASDAFENMFSEGVKTPVLGQGYYCSKEIYPPIPEPVPNLCFTNIADSIDATIKIQKFGSPTGQYIQYSIDNVTFNDYTIDSPIVLRPSDRIYFRGNNTTGFNNSTSNYYQFVTTGGSLKASGNIMSLIDNGACATTTIPNDYCFVNLFEGCSTITTIPDLPATTLKPDCYYRMFENCTGLVDLSSYTLPAEDISSDAQYCYLCMFQGCTGLKKAPAIAAKKMGVQTCVSMFCRCTSLQYAPELPATVLAARCYESMFSGCTSLKSIPSIQTTEFPEYCVKDMFGGTNLNITTEYSSDRQYYRLPRVGQATTTEFSLSDMFSGTTGVVKPDANTLYYINAESVNPPVPNMLYFYAEDGAATITLNKEESPEEGTFYYKRVADTQWTTYTPNSTISLADKDVILFKGDFPEGLSTFSYKYYYFSMTGKVYADGNIMSLIDNGACTTTTIPNDYCFYSLFRGCTSLTHAPSLPATTLSKYCYEYMFYNCTSLTTPPALPATTLTYECYERMFEGCTSLTAAPVLSATNLATYCYYCMFHECTSLTTAPALPAMILADDCYGHMFDSCTSLTTAPALPAMTLASHCYDCMFQKCTSLTTAPVLPATDPVSGCYFAMFSGCTSLRNIPSIQLTTYNEVLICGGMFGDTGLTLATEASATHTKRYRVPASGTYTGRVGDSAFGGMFGSETSPETLSINTNYYVNADSVTPEIPEYVSYFYLENATTANTSVDVTISKYGSITEPPAFEYNTGSGWSDYTLGTAITLTNSGDKVQFRGDNTKIGPSAAAYCRVTADGYINAGGNIMTLLDTKGESVVLSGDNNFVCLFKGCGYLKSAADLKLPATTLVDSCYKQLFYGCTSLTTPPASLPATTAAGDSYYGMFEGCTSLASVPTMEVTSAASRCCSRMFYGCKNVGFTSAANIIINTTAESSYYGMFYNCTKLTTPPTFSSSAISLNSYCFQEMFSSCASLQSAPVMTVTEKATGAMQKMFQSCTGLTTAAGLTLNTTGIMTDMYRNMFYGCTSLTTPPDHICNSGANVTGSQACDSMFYGCTALKSAPAIPAAGITGGDNDLYKMFYNCTSLETAPELPATTLRRWCYYQMFYGCTSLTHIPSLPATTMTQGCYQEMFKGCTGLKFSETKTAECQYAFRCPSVGSLTEATDWNKDMFSGTSGTFTGNPVKDTKYYCNKTVYPELPVDYLCFTNVSTSNAEATISMTAVGTPATNLNLEYSTDRTNWNTFTAGITTVTIASSGSKVYFRGNNESGIGQNEDNYWKFVMTGNIAASGNIMSLIDGQDTLLTIPGSGCFTGLFSGCTSLTTAPALPATTLAQNCYRSMFLSCSYLITAPALPATTLAKSCYRGMFSACDRLQSAPDVLPAETLTEECYMRMFNGCSNITTAPEIKAVGAAANYCCERMFYGCSSLRNIPSLKVTDVSYSHMCELMFYNTGIRIWDNSGEGHTVKYRIPIEGTGGSVGSNAFNQMFSSGGDKVTPYINTVYYTNAATVTPPVPVDYLTFTANTAGSTIGVAVTGTPTRTLDLWYSTDRTSWTQYTPAASGSQTMITLANAGDKIYWKGVNSNGFSESGGIYYQFKMTGSLAGSGNIMTLIDGTGDALTIPNQYCFYYLFYSCTSLTSPPDLPATTITSYCYKSMFYGCTNLITPPTTLPAMATYIDSYAMMFMGCSKLTSIPTLPATSLYERSYYGMFMRCNALTDLSSYNLPAQTVAANCYQQMFDSCSGLTKAPSISATIVRSYGCGQMFQSCTSLTTVPSFSINEAYNNCCWRMFYGCNKVTDASGITITRTANSGYESMFEGCTALTEAPTLSATTLAMSCYKNMFSGCKALTTAPTLSATTLAINCYSNMFMGCTSLTTPPALSATTLAMSCYYSMFEGCTGLTSVPTFKATTVYSDCCRRMFYGCNNTGFTNAYGITINETANNSYESMFEGCTYLETPPIITATTALQYCYYNMFKSCAALTTTHELLATTAGAGAYWGMYHGCTSLTTPAIIHATSYGADTCYVMFKGCTGIKVSATQGGGYEIPYSIPSSGTVADVGDSFGDMFIDTGGTFKGTPEITVGGSWTGYLYGIVPEPADYLDFSSDSAFSLKLDKAESGGTWDGTMQVGQIVSGELKWTTIDPDATRAAYTSSYISSENKHHVYLRGTGNTRLGSSSEKYNTITFPMGSGVKVKGNIQCLLDYENPGVTTLSDQWAFYNLFSGNTGLTDASELVLPYTTISANCYYNMFQNCTNLVTSPTSIPATVTKDSCCARMFYNCTSLTTAPSLPAASAARSCYGNMFYGCSNLEQLPTLPATGSLGWRCYANMFDSCTKIKLSETQTGEYQTAYRIPTTGSATEGGDSTYKMFLNTKGTWPGGDYGTAELGKTYYTSNTVV